MKACLCFTGDKLMGWEIYLLTISALSGRDLMVMEARHGGRVGWMLNRFAGSLRSPITLAFPSRRRSHKFTMCDLLNCFRSRSVLVCASDDVVSCWFVHDRDPKPLAWLMSDHHCSTGCAPPPRRVRPPSLTFHSHALCQVSHQIQLK